MSIATAMTAEQMWELPDVPGKRFELIDGELIEVPGAGAFHGLIVGIVYSVLATAARQAGGLAFPDGVSYILSRRPDVVRIPDASFVARSNVPQDGVPVGFWPIGPDLAVEIVSPHDRAADIQAKTRDYLDAGTQRVWVLWPGTRSVTISDATGASRQLGPDDALDGGDLLPGLRVRVADLFPPVP